MKAGRRNWVILAAVVAAASVLFLVFHDRGERRPKTRRRPDIASGGHEHTGRPNIKEPLPVPPRTSEGSPTYSQLEDVTLGSISGRLIDTEGNPIENWQEQILPVDFEIIGQGLQRRIDIRPDGSYEINGLPDGTYWIARKGWEFRLPGRYYCCVRLPQNIEPGTTGANIVMACGNPGTIRGKVLRAQTMDPVTNFTVLHKFDFESAYDRSRQCALYPMMLAGAGPQGNLANIAYFRRERDSRQNRVNELESLGPDVHPAYKADALSEFHTFKILLESQHLEIESQEGVFQQSGYLLGTHTFTVMADGFLANSMEVELKDANPVEVTFLMTEQGSTMTGRIEDDSGEPVEGATVRTRIPTNTDYYYMWEASPNWETLEFVTDESGQFAFANLGDAIYEVTASKVGFPTVAASRVSLLNGRQEPSDLILRMRRGDASVWGQVTGADGSPAAGAPVKISSGSHYALRVADSDGYYSATGFPAGDHIITIDKGGFRDREYHVCLVPSQQLRYHIAMSWSSSLKGTIVAGGGGKLASRLRLVLRSERLTLKSERHRGGGFDRADYEFSSLPPGRYKLELLSDMFGNREYNITIAPDEAKVLDINLGLYGSLKGRTIGRHGAPVAGARLVVVSPGRESSTSTDEEGRYSFSDLSPGHIQVKIPAGEFAGTWYEFELKKKQDKELDIDFSTTGDVKGRILKPDGRPLGLAALRVESAHRTVEVITDREGQFSVEGLFPGQCRIDLPVPHLGRAFPFELAPKEKKEIEIILPP